MPDFEAPLSRRAELEADAATRIKHLTVREREVLIHLVRGESSKQIARALQISPRTVEIHRAHLMLKIGARSTPDAVRIAVYAGLDEDSKMLSRDQ